MMHHDFVYHLSFTSFFTFIFIFLLSFPHLPSPPLLSPSSPLISSPLYSSHLPSSFSSFLRQALTNFGTLALQQNLISQAILVGETATSVLYNQRASHLNLGLAYQKNGDFIRSIKSFETVLKVRLGLIMSSTNFFFII